VRTAEGRKVGAPTRLASFIALLTFAFLTTLVKRDPKRLEDRFFGHVAAGCEDSKKNSIFPFLALDGVRIRNRIQNSR